MRRLSVFVILGPFLSWLAFVAMFVPKLLTGPPFDGGLPFFIIALLVCYAPGALFLLVLAGVDKLLSRYHWALRMGICALIGFGTAYTLFYFLSRGGPEKDFQEYWFFLGLMGGLPAAACSWLSNERPTIRAKR